MDFRALLKLPYDQWPYEEYAALYEVQKEMILPELRRHYENDANGHAPEYPYLHDLQFISVEYTNPVDQLYVNPTLTLTLSDGGFDHIHLVFTHVCEMEMTTPEPLENYHAAMEDVMRAYIRLIGGRMEFVCQFASGWGLYVRAAGIDYQCEKWNV